MKSYYTPPGARWSAKKPPVTAADTRKPLRPPLTGCVLVNQCGCAEVRLVKIDAGWCMYAAGVMSEEFASLERALTAAVERYGPPAGNWRRAATV